jgi:hypothetical protein
MTTVGAEDGHVKTARESATARALALAAAGQDRSER